jgi:hypothetical protein
VLQSFYLTSNVPSDDWQKIDHGIADMLHFRTSFWMTQNNTGNKYQQIPEIKHAQMYVDNDRI